jgi:hypothetical protein
MNPAHRSATSATSATPLISGTSQVAGSAPDPLPDSEGSVSHPLPATSNSRLTRGVTRVAEVAPTNGHRTCLRCGRTDGRGRARPDHTSQLQ